MNEQFYQSGYGYQAPFYAQPLQQQPLVQPNYQNALTEAEIAQLRSSKPAGIDLTFEPEEALRAMCTHKHNGRDVVQKIEGTDEVYCPICGERWAPQQVSKDELQELVNRLIARMQDSKWAGELPINVVREYYQLIPLLKKFPDIFEYGNKNFNKLINMASFVNANDSNLYSGYNSLFTGTMGYGNMYQQPMNYYNQPVYPQNTYYQQPPAGYYQPPMQQPVYPQAPNYQQPVQQPVGTPAQPAVNPMQAPAGAPATQQYTQQAQMMMPGYPPAYGQPPVQQPINPYASTIPVQNVTQAPAQPVQEQMETKKVKIDL